ncbi:MAG: hypothetical protein ACYCXE_07670 [Thermoleophilia bacterium]
MLAISRTADIVALSRRGVDDALEDTIVAPSAAIAMTSMVARKAAECHLYVYLLYVPARGLSMWGCEAIA